MTIEPDRELSLVNQGYAALRSGIVRGTYPPGVRLKLDTLQQALGVSSSPLREALNRLVAEGLVEVEEGRGFRAAQISAKEFGDHVLSSRFVVLAIITLVPETVLWLPRLMGYKG